MKTVDYKNINNTAFFETIDFEQLDSVNQIISKVKAQGDTALIELSKQFKDGDFKNPNDFIVSDDEIEKVYNNADKDLINHIKIAIDNVKEFSINQLKCIKNLEFEKENSILGHKIIPMQSVLCYCPGGRYPLLSSCYMTIVPAVVAGVKEIFLTSPKISPEVILSAHLSGATKIYKLGGAQAIAAFAFGTQSIKPVDKITGPGNKYVAAAKKTVFGTCDIDFIAGPSEVLIVSDEIESAQIIACDMLAQAEHDIDARAYLITKNPNLAELVEKEAMLLLKELPTREIAKISFEKSIAVVVQNNNQIVDIVNKRAPEHLELIGREYEDMKDEFLNYGSLFIGKKCAEVFGDYCSGTNHVLPTNTASRYTGGLSVFDYIKIQTYQKLSDKYSNKLSDTASYLAQKEGLFAHKKASDIRKDTSGY